MFVQPETITGAPPIVTEAQATTCHIIVLILHRTLDTSLLCETNKQKIFQNAVHWSQMCGQLAMCTHHTNIHKTANSWVYVSINRGLSNLLWEQVHHASCAHSLPSVNLCGKLCHVWNRALCWEHFMYSYKSLKTSHYYYMTQSFEGQNLAKKRVKGSDLKFLPHNDIAYNNHNVQIQ